MGRFTLRDLGQTISLRAARGYLARHGWRIREDGLRLVCEGPDDDDGRPIVHFLPAEQSYADYPLRLEDLISTLSVLEERPAVEIAAEMARCDEPAIPPTRSLEDDLAGELSRPGVHVAPGRDRKQVIRELSALVTNAEMAIHESPGEDDVVTPYVQAAQLAVRFVRLVSVSRASNMILWRLCNRVLAPAGLRLPSSPDKVHELCGLATSHDPKDLDDVFLWMRGHTKKVRSTTEGKRNRRAGAEHSRPRSDSRRPAD